MSGTLRDTITSTVDDEKDSTKFLYITAMLLNIIASSYFGLTVWVSFLVHLVARTLQINGMQRLTFSIFTTLMIQYHWSLSNAVWASFGTYMLAACLTALVYYKEITKKQGDENEKTE